MEFVDFCPPTTNKNYLRVVFNGVDEIFNICTIGERDLNFISRKTSSEITAGAAVDVVDAQNVISGFQ